MDDCAAVVLAGGQGTRLRAVLPGRQKVVAEVGGERRLLGNDDLLRERTWEAPLTRLSLQDGGGPQPAQVLLGPGAPPVRMAIAREWVQPRWRLELVNEDGAVQVDFDETGRATLAP